MNAKRARNGLWYWDDDFEKEVNFDLFGVRSTQVNGSYRFATLYKGSWKPSDVEVLRYTKYVCEAPSKFIDDFPELPADSFPDRGYSAYHNPVSNDNYIMFHEMNKRPWHDAKKHCEFMGGYLAEMASESEEEDILKELARTSNHSWYWLGGLADGMQARWAHYNKTIENVGKAQRNGSSHSGYELFEIDAFNQ